MINELKAWAEERAYERAKAKYMEKLDKIRAEIERTAKDYDKLDDYRSGRGLRIALGIIDKCESESEE